MSTMNISLPETLKSFVDTQVSKAIMSAAASMCAMSYERSMMRVQLPPIDIGWRCLASE